MNKVRTKIIIITIIISMLVFFGVAYGFFQYYKAGNNTNQLIAGEVYLTFDDGTDSLEISNIFPETKEEARSRDDNFITFTIYGKNTTTNKDIWYEIILNE